MSDVMQNKQQTNTGNADAINAADATLEQLSPHVLEALNAIARKNAITAHKLEMRPVSGVGENSYGLVLQVKLVPTMQGCSTAPIYVILKISPKNAARRSHMRVVDYYAREVFMYERVFSAFDAIAVQQHTHFDITPQMLHYSLQAEDEFIIFEDLAQKDYAQNSRNKMPDFELVASALKSVAQLHAMSFVLQAKEPCLFKSLIAQLSDNLFEESMEQVTVEFGKQYVKRTRTLLEAGNTPAAADGAERMQCIEALKRIEHNFKDICLHCVNGGKCAPHAVICHGDFWNNNILYRNEHSGIEHATTAKLIDFQMSRYASPVLDVVHYLFACTEPALRHKHFHEFLQIYYDALDARLTLFQLQTSKIYSRQMFDAQLREYAVYGFVMSAFAIPFFISNTNELPDLDEVSQAVVELSEHDDSNVKAEAQTGHATNQNIESDANEAHKFTEILKEYDLLTERTLPIFKRRMIGIIKNLVEYDLLANAALQAK